MEGDYSYTWGVGKVSRAVCAPNKGAGSLSHSLSLTLSLSLHTVAGGSLLINWPFNTLRLPGATTLCVLTRPFKKWKEFSGSLRGGWSFTAADGATFN